MQYDAFGRPGGGAPNTQTNYGSMNAAKVSIRHYSSLSQRQESVDVLAVEGC